MTNEIKTVLESATITIKYKTSSGVEKVFTGTLAEQAKVQHEMGILHGPMHYEIMDDIELPSGE